MIEDRKADHIDIYLTKKVVATWNHWDDIILVHNPVPDVDLDEIDPSTRVFGKKLSAPFIIAGMTGGHEKARKINENLAYAASEAGIGMGLGSQRAGVENPDVRHTYSVVKEYDIPLVLGNLGAPQFIKTEKNRRVYGLDEIDLAMEMVGADLVAIHLNYLQEVVQVEGDLFSRGFWEVMAPLCKKRPLLLKETGGGITRHVAEMAKENGFRGIDVGGMSGTTFSGVEKERAEMKGDRFHSTLGGLLWDWGIPTPVSVMETRVGIPLIATGGIRNGLDGARAMVLGADLFGMAGVLLRPAVQGKKEALEAVSTVIEQFKRVMFLLGTRTPSEMKDRPWIAMEPTKTWLATRKHQMYS